MTQRYDHQVPVVSPPKKISDYTTLESTTSWLQRDPVGQWSIEIQIYFSNSFSNRIEKAPSAPSKSLN
ncbi:hypothetical protein XaraCFBP7407_21560 [Xanthomonas arboricola pv. arracaciae]|nr:hypothetical protein XaraCFBP7407_21560 [Xanthomonas arboricola pv. arracaciae]